MQYMEHDLGSRSRGDQVVVTLRGNVANVQLMDSSQRSNYKNRRSYRAQGGHYKRSPVHLTVPRSGHWYVMVDLGGYPGRVNSSVKVLPGKLPPGRSRPPRSSALGSVSPMESAQAIAVQPPSPERGCDVYIAHAHEDKDTVVQDLAEALKASGLLVWYDNDVTRIGDSFRRSIDNGLAHSRFGVVVISPAFFAAKHWTHYELDGLVTRESTGEQVVLPIWHDITKEEIIAHSPSLADKKAARTSDSTIAEIAEAIAERVQS